MGSLVTAYFLNKQSAEWRQRNLASFIAMSAPFEGAVTALKGEHEVSLDSKKSSDLINMFPCACW